MFRGLDERMSLSFWRYSVRVAVMSAATIFAAVSIVPSVASSAPKPKRNKQVICSSIVSSQAVAAATQVAVGPALDENGYGRVVFPSKVPFYQLRNILNSLPGSTCGYNYANGGQGDSNTYGPEVALVAVGFGPVTLSAWNSYEAWQRKNAFAGAVGHAGTLGSIGTLGFQALHLGDGSRAFEMSLVNYFENSATGTPVTAYEIFAMTRHGNIIEADLSPVLVSSSAETDSNVSMLQALVSGALSKGPF